MTPVAGHSNKALDFVQRNPLVTSAALVTLIAGTAFAVRIGSGASTRMEWRIDGVTCTATGGLASYAYCNWQEPSDNSGSGSKILAIYYSVGNSPIQIGIDGTIGVSATVSGSTAITALTNKTTSTGAYFEFIADSSTSSISITEGDYLRLVTLTNPGAGHTASMMIKSVSRITHD